MKNTVSLYTEDDMKIFYVQMERIKILFPHRKQDAGLVVCSLEIRYGWS